MAISLRRTIAYLTPDQIARLLNFCHDKRSHLLVNVLWRTGARITEAIRLTPDHLDPTAKVIRIESVKRRVPVRQVPLADDLAAELMDYVLHHQDQMPHGRFFPFSRGQAWRIITDIAARAGLSNGASGRRIFPHIFRHSFAIHHLKNQTGLPVIQALLGHQDIGSTAIYLKTLQQEDAVAIARHVVFSEP